MRSRREHHNARHRRLGSALIRFLVPVCSFKDLGFGCGQPESSNAGGCYDDGGFSGGDTDRPALQRLLADVQAGKIDVIVVYKVDRLTRSLADFAKLVE